MSIYGTHIPHPDSAFIAQASYTPITSHTRSYVQHQAAGALAELAHQISDPILGRKEECLERLERAFEALDPLTQTLEALDITPKSHTSRHEERLATIMIYALNFPQETDWVHTHHALYGIFFKTEYLPSCTPLFELYAAQAMERTMIHLVSHRGCANLSTLQTLVDLLLKRRRALFNQILMLGFSSDEARQYLRILLSAEIAEPATHLHRFLIEYNRAAERIVTQALETVLLTVHNSTYAPLFISATERIIGQLHIPMLMYIDELQFTPQDFNHAMRRINILWKDAREEQCTRKALRSFFKNLAQMHAWKVYENLHACTPQDNLLTSLSALFLEFYQSCVNLEKIV